MAKISGVLKDGAGQIINNCTIELHAKKTSSKVLTQTQAFNITTDGKYEMDVLPCNYDVYLIINGFPRKSIGCIQVFSDSVDGTLNDYLLNPTESEITPAILQQVMDLRNEATKAAKVAEESVDTVVKNAESAQLSATQSQNNADSAEVSASNASKSEKASKASEDSAKGYSESASTSAQSADSSKTASALSEKNAKASEDNAEASAETATTKATEITEAATVATNSAKEAKKSEDNAAISAKNAKTSENNTAASEKSAKESATAASASSSSAADNASAAESSANLAATSESNAGKSATAAKTSETNSAVSETNAEKYANQAKTSAESIDMANYVKKSDMVGEFKLFPFRTSELPKGWYFRGGDNFLLSSPQGQVLNSLSANYKSDHGIIIKTISGQQYINVPDSFTSDGRGFFERATNGTTKKVGEKEWDAIRNITAYFAAYSFNTSTAYNSNATGAFTRTEHNRGVLAAGNSSNTVYDSYNFDASRCGIPTSDENKPVSLSLTPAIYLGV